MKTDAATLKRVYAMSLAGVYPHYVAKAEKKGRTKAEVDEIIRWLTGYTQKQLESILEKRTTIEAFISKAKMNPSRALVFNVNGASRSSNNIRIDGVSTTNIWLPHVAAYVPALESLETVNVVTNSFDAEQGLAGGSAINAQIKSGTNNFHGSAFEYHTNESLRTQNYFAPAGTPKGD